jgi:hypothetical protein
LNSQGQSWFAETAKKAIAWRATNRLRSTSEEKKLRNAVACAYLLSDVGTTAVEKVLFTQVLECGLDARVIKMGSPKWIAAVGRTMEKPRPLRPARAAHQRRFPLDVRRRRGNDFAPPSRVPTVDDGRA